MAVYTIPHHPHDSLRDLDPTHATLNDPSIPADHHRPVRNLSDLPMVLTVEDLRSALSISRNSAYQLIRSGQIRSIKIGSKGIRIPKDALLEFLSK